MSNRVVRKKKNNVFQFGKALPRKNSNNQKLVASAAESPAGNASLDGDDIRPALPITTLDPVITPADLAGGVKGDVIVEVTIASNGSMVATKIEHGLRRAVDQKVLAAIEGWRFRPAMKDGRAISSKQDIHYHFPANDVGPNSQAAPMSAAVAQSPCPVLLVGGTADQNHVSITFRNMGKLPIRQLEFNCGAPNPSVRTMADLSRCRENNALFYPGLEYTLSYAVPRRSPNVQISVQSVTLSDGYVWKPTRSQSCRMMAINVDQHLH